MIGKTWAVMSSSGISPVAKSEPGSPTTGTTPVEVKRSTTRPYNADSYASVIVQVRAKN